jgi:glyoxylase-like metal-dependent hydrolase (beta-lactamase superfamily II)
MVKGKTISNLLTNIYVVHDPMFPLYVIRGEQNLLIDCGILAGVKEIEKNLQELLGGKKIHLTLLTHSHYDHTGTCSYLQNKYGFEIIASQRTKEILGNSKAIAFIDDLNQKFKKLLNDASDTVFTRPQNIRAVKEKDVIELPNGQTIEVFETPGHTRCSISFFLKPENILFPGDAAGVVEKNGKIKPLFLSSFSQYECSLRKLITLESDILALPHNNAIKGRKRIQEFLSNSLAATRELKTEITKALQNTRDFNLIAEDILKRDYPLPAIMGPREALLINVTSMVKSIFYEFEKTP